MDRSSFFTFSQGAIAPLYELSVACYGHCIKLMEKRVLQPLEGLGHIKTLLFSDYFADN